MSDMDLVAYINEENKRRKRRRIVLTNGDHAQNGWKSHVYSAVIGNVHEKCSVTITKENISSRCKTFENHYEAISKMLSQSGFGWDWINNKLSIDSEDVWLKYVAANKKVGFYKNRVIKNWDAITTIYSKDHANGEGDVTGAETIVEPTTEPNEASPEVPQKNSEPVMPSCAFLGI
uniref:Myb/SANT-like domain-containing protein n=1 Tax=Aegilops tauschii subsp. strangulata TaxID=200361 RepID=A0A452YD99_AEGTS|nr:uncharacterized protein LOC109738305 [Aegilops tauschii subsp. strangulata]